MYKLQQKYVMHNTYVYPGGIRTNRRLFVKTSVMPLRRGIRQKSFFMPKMTSL
jgi:hypothetical protein